MIPTREIFWNVGDLRVAIYFLAAVPLGIAFYGILRRYTKWRMGKEEKRLDHVPQRFRFLVQSLVGHQKILQESYPGLMHLFIFWGFGVLFLGTLTIAFQEDILFPILGKKILLGNFYLLFSLLLDIFGLFALAGISMAIYRRYVIRPRSLDRRPSDIVMLSLLLWVVITGFIVEGLRLTVLEPSWALWEPVGFLLGRVFNTFGIAAVTQKGLHKAFWWVHLVASMGVIIYFPFSNLFHIISSPLNLFFRSLGPSGALAPIDFQKEKPFGVAHIPDFTWKQLLDLDACTRCGRCQENCPAYLGQKPLNPKKLIQDLKTSLNLPLRSREDLPLAGQSISEEDLWDCTTCQACVESCPVEIGHLEKIVGLRRYLVMEEAKIPQEYKKIFKNMEIFGDPFGGGSLTREDWLTNVKTKRVYQDNNIEVLLWVGCTGSLYDERTKNITAAAAKVLNKAGINFGILGKQELCCGDPARRMGNEYLFLKIANQNITILKKHKIKKLVTFCPHCFNVFRNEYPLLGGAYEVIHFSQLIKILLDGERLVVKSKTEGFFTYHDPCYLGRYNKIYQVPRDVLGSVSASGIKEMAYSREVAFCCGAGGGNLWRGKTTGRRLEEMRIEQAIATKTDGLITACPFCKIMFESAIRQKGLEASFKVLDIVELVDQVT